MTISSFELEVESRDGGERKYKLHRVGGEVKARIIRREPGAEKVVERGRRAVEEAERLIAEIKPDKDMSEEQLVERACAALLLQTKDVHYLDVEIGFTSRSEIHAGITNGKLPPGQKETRR